MTHHVLVTTYYQHSRNVLAVSLHNLLPVPIHQLSLISGAPKTFLGTLSRVT